MKYAKIMSFLACIVILGSYFVWIDAKPTTAIAPQLNVVQVNSGPIKKLELAEINHDIESISALFAEDAVIYVPDGMPFAGKQAIVSLYEYLWNNTDNKTVNYLVERTETTAENYIEYGTNTSINKAAVENTNNFKAVYIQTGSSYLITELSFGDAATVAPKLLAPTGKYGVGQATYFYPADATENGRIMAFQIWYPADTGDGDRAKLHSTEAGIASAEFLGLPPFMYSFGSIVTSNSVLGAQAVPGHSFPVLIYNHGYSGFTAVYQTVFEELASHGYIVVSVGHENESSLFIRDDGTILPTDPDNQFYTSRSPELEGAAINALQSTILNADDLAKIKRAYRQLVETSPLHNESTRLWASDTTQVIGKLREVDADDSRMKGTFDFDAIGVMGHSVGGATAGQLAFDNDQIKAGINLDGFQFGDLVNNHLEIPFMFVSSNQNGDTYLRASNFTSESEADCYQAVLSGFTHGSFTDLTFFQPHGQKSINLQRDLILGFFNKYLKKLDVDLEAIDAKYPEMVINGYTK